MNFVELANESIRHLTPYQPGKPIAELERELGITSSIKLASNENPLGPSPLAVQAAQLELLNAHIYPDGAYYDLKNAIANHHGIQAAQLTVGNGSDNVLELIVKSYLNKGDNAVISEYTFLTIPIILKSYGIQLNISPAQNWGHDIDAMLAAIDDNTRVLFLVNPNNPTGTFTTKKDFEKLLHHVPKHILIVVDEAYAEYMQTNDYADSKEYLKHFPNLIITRTFSKIYGLAALRVGYSISSSSIADILNRARLPFNVNNLAARAACAALDDHRHVRASLELNKQGMEQLLNGCSKLKLEVIPSTCNFITINVGDGSETYEALLKEGVIVRPLKAYQMPQHIRVTIGTLEENKRFLNALEKIR